MNLSTSSSKKYIRNFLLFVGILYIVALSFESYANSLLRRSTHDDFITWSKIINGELEKEIVFAGSSRALVHYDCEHFEEKTDKTCYNIGLNASGIHLQNPQIKALFRHNEAPEYLVVSLDPYSFDLDQFTNPIFKPYQYSAYFHDKQLYKDLVDVDREFFWRRYIPMYDYAKNRETVEIALSTAFNQDPTWRVLRDNYGFRGVENEWDGKFEKFVEENPDGVFHELDSRLVSELTEIIDTAKSYGTKVILALSPVYEAYDDYFINKDEVLAFLSNYSIEQGVDYWDYYYIEGLSNDRDYFYNSQHLNAKGAEIYTGIVAEQLLMKQSTMQTEN